MATRWQHGPVFLKEIPETAFRQCLGLQLLGGTPSAAYLLGALAKPSVGSFFLSDSIVQASWEKMLFLIQPSNWDHITKFLGQLGIEPRTKGIARQVLYP